MTYYHSYMNAWFNSTCYHPPHRQTTRNLIFFKIWSVIPCPLVRKKESDNINQPRTPIYLTYVCMCTKKGGNISLSLLNKGYCIE